MAKSTRRTASADIAAADPSSKILTDGAASVTDGDIACRAYELYLGRGRDHGHDEDDWLTAERELRRTTPAGAA